jgi:hypothetical protein
MPERLGGSHELDDKDKKKVWISIPETTKNEPDYDREFLLSGDTKGKVPQAVMKRMINKFRLGGQQK